MTHLLDPSKENSSFSSVHPGLQIAWDSTSLGTLKECPRKYQYSIMLGRQPRELSVHLAFGLYYHAALEWYDHEKSKGLSHQQAFASTIRKTLSLTWDSARKRPWISDDKYKNRLTLLRSVVWYLDQFSSDTVKTIQLSNGKPAVELSFRLNLGYKAPSGEEYMICGHIDRLVSFNDQPYVLDRKTTKSTLSPDFFSKFSPDNQMSTYAFAAKIIYNTPAQGLIIDAAQIGITFTRFQRGLVARTAEQLEDWYGDTLTWIAMAEQFARSQYWPQNDKSCLAGETIIKITRGAFKGKKISIEDYFNMIYNRKAGTRFNPNLRTYALSDLGGYVGQNEVLDVLQQGVKPVFRLQTAETYIDATADHKFNTPSGWKRLDQLKVGDTLFIWSGKKSGWLSTKRNPPRKEIGNLPFYPNGYIKTVGQYNYRTQREYILVAEANLNKMPLDKFIWTLRNDATAATKLSFLAKGQEVHHKDGNVANNALENLEILSENAHAKKHEKERVEAMNRLAQTQVVSIVPLGEKMTYDLVMAAPYHNFIANDLVAHNCGNYGGCPFRSVCSQSPSTRGLWLTKDFSKRIWNPLISRGDV